MIKNGVFFNVRGSNHKWNILDNLDNLYEMLKTKSIAQVSKELKVPQNSIRYRIFKYFSPQEIKAIKRQRAFHRKQKTLLKEADTIKIEGKE